jgi:selenocysteine-specific elongation factor
VRDDVVETSERAVSDLLAAFHRDHPLADGLEVGAAREAVMDTLRTAGVRAAPALADALLEDLVRRGVASRTSSVLRAPSHRSGTASGSPEVERLVAAIGGTRSTSPPTISELVAGGIPRSAIDAAIRTGAVTRVAPDLVFANEAIDHARAIVGATGTEGITVSAFREALGTSRKYAMPILEWFDLRGVTRRDGDRRFARGAR